MLSSSTLPPIVTESALEGGIETFGAALEGWSEYLNRALQRHATPLEVVGDLTRWWQAMATRREPTWATHNKVLWETPITRLRDFTQPGHARDEVVPTLVVPPQAGHHSSVVDYSPEQSQVHTIRAAGLTRCLSLDWLGATQETKHTTVDDYLHDVDRAVETAGGRVNLLGDCQGGWLSAIYAALRPERVHTLTIAGAPIDFHAGEPVIGGWMEALDPGFDLAFYRALVASGGGVLRGEYQLGGFIAIKPQDEVARQLALLAHLDEPEHTHRYAAFEDWFKYTQDMAGEFYLWAVEHLFRDNKLVRGTLEIGGELVDLGRITCPVFLLAGEEDHITPPPQVFAAGEHVGTPPDEIHHRLAPGGHLGLFMGRQSLREHWPHVLADVHAHSSPDHELERWERRARRRTPAGHKPELPVP